jgi:hypothetical protein
MDIKKVIKLYQEDKLSINKIWKQFKRSNSYIKQILLDNDVEINHKNRKKYIYTDEHRRKIWDKSKWRKSTLWFKQTELTRRKNMVWHLKRRITLDDIEKYNDIEKLIFLNNVIWRHRKYFEDDVKYIKYLDKFYFDDIFNNIYNEWIENWKCKWKLPSLEHLLPISKWGTFDLYNLTFTTWFENRAKAEMTLEEWRKFQKDTWTKSNLFYL